MTPILLELPRIAPPGSLDLISEIAASTERTRRAIGENLERIEEVLRPRGVAVMLEAEHFCKMMRGVAKQQSMTVTSFMLGEFRDYPNLRDEFFDAVGRECRR